MSVSPLEEGSGGWGGGVLPVTQVEGEEFGNLVVGVKVHSHVSFCVYGRRKNGFCTEVELCLTWIRRRRPSPGGPCDMFKSANHSCRRGTL